MAEELVPIKDVPIYIVSWLMKELARTPNFIEIKNKYKRIFKEDITEAELSAFQESYKTDIDKLKEFTKKDIDNHVMSDPHHRMDKLMEIAEDALIGEPVLDNKGRHVGDKKNFMAAVQAIKECRQEQAQALQYELDLLKILIQTGQAGQIKPPVKTENINALPPIQAEVKDVTEIKSDTDKYFEK